MIKKTFQYIGLIVLVCASFIYTEKAVLVVREQDPLMIEIEENKNKYRIEPENAIITEFDITPGYEGKKVNVNKSYENMKKYGLYNENMLKFDAIKPTITIDETFDKYIVNGNKTKKSISLIFKVDENDDISKINEILKNNKVVANFFLSEKYIENNKDIIKELKKNGNEIGHTNYNSLEELLFTNRLLSSIVEKTQFCYTEEYNEEILNMCKNISMHTVKPTIIKGKNMLIETKKVLNSGMLLSFKINDNLNQELEHIITYINQKGYTITTLSNHLNEKRLEK